MKKPIRTLYHNYSDDCCGFCKRHWVGVTVKQMHKKKCLEKECRHFQKYAKHSYWTQCEQQLQAERIRKEERKILRKKRKETQQKYFENLAKGQHD